MSGTIALEQPFFSTFLFKTASRCNLNCTYCYVYNRGDSSWRTRPKTMRADVFRTACVRIRDHIQEHGIESPSLIFHGGEPLLVGVRRFRQYLNIIDEVFTVSGRPSLGLQTNGVLIASDAGDEWLDLFEEYEIPIGLSLDGVTETTNRQRIDHNGRSSLQTVLSAINRIRQRPQLWERLGLLKVIDPYESPVAVAERIRSLGVRRCDFIQPLLHWNSPFVDDHAEYQACFANYWKRLASWWWEQSGDDFLEIRTFVVWGSHFLGVHQGLDAWGGGASHILVIETDGCYELTDSFKVLGEGFTSLGQSVIGTCISDLFKLDKLKWIWTQSQQLPTQCSMCRFRAVCGGGYLPTRFNGTDFSMPSYHCAGILEGLDVMRAKMLAEATTLTSTHLGPH